MLEFRQTPVIPHLTAAPANSVNMPRETACNSYEPKREVEKTSAIALGLAIVLMIGLVLMLSGLSA